MRRQDARRILRALDALAANPEKLNPNVAALRGRPGFRLRVGDIRIIFERHDEARMIDVLRIAPRGQAYKQ